MSVIVPESGAPGIRVNTPLLWMRSAGLREFISGPSHDMTCT